MLNLEKNPAILHITLWKNQKFTLTDEIFRQINYLVISLVDSWFHEIFA